MDHTARPGVVTNSGLVAEERHEHDQADDREGQAADASADAAAYAAGNAGALAPRGGLSHGREPTPVSAVEEEPSPGDVDSNGDLAAALYARLRGAVGCIAADVDPDAQVGLVLDLLAEHKEARR